MVKKGLFILSVVSAPVIASDREQLVLGLLDEEPASKVEQRTDIQDIENTVQDQSLQIGQNKKILDSIIAEQARLDVTKKVLFQRIQQLEKSKQSWQQEKQQMMALYVSMKKSLKQTTKKRQALAKRKAKQLKKLSTLHRVGQVQNRIWLKNGTGQIFVANVGEQIQGYGRLTHVDQQGIAVFSGKR